ncbi:MAG: hypothetical protein ACLUNS_01390 [Alistipes shahii]
MLLPVAKVTKLFGAERGGGVVVALYTEFPEDFAPESEPLFVRIDSLDVPLWCERFERSRSRGRAGGVRRLGYGAASLRTGGARTLRRGR